MGQVSYAVYIIHQPIIWLALKFGIKGHPAWWLLVAPLILAIGAAMEYGLQPLARNAVRRLFPPIADQPRLIADTRFTFWHGGHLPLPGPSA